MGPNPHGIGTLGPLFPLHPWPSPTAGATHSAMPTFSLTTKSSSPKALPLQPLPTTPPPQGPHLLA